MILQSKIVAAVSKGRLGFVRQFAKKKRTDRFGLARFIERDLKTKANKNGARCTVECHHYTALP